LTIGGDPARPELVTLVRAGAPGAAEPAPASGFPSDLLGQAAQRLKVLALLYAFIFFMAGVLPALLFAEARAAYLGDVTLWGPAAAGIASALVVVLAIRRPGLSPGAALNIGPFFEVVSSYAIAAAELGNTATLESPPVIGLSWVAVWVLLFTVVVPTTPRRAVLAALASVSSVSVVVGLMIWSGASSLRIPPSSYFLGLVFPYLLVVLMAYVGARVVYQLGTEVRRARELGSYQLEEKLGEGGMGEVWRGRHRMLARPAAVKLIRPGIQGGGTSAEAARRFEREAQVIASLRSPHTVTLFDYGVASDGTFYYAMELLDGMDADTLVRRHGPVPAARAVHLLLQVCHSLSEAHAAGLAHRDVKPANIFLCRYGEEYDFVKVLDFGIVGAEQGAAGPAGAVTSENAVRGTPAFMAPEQALGAAVDGRADIYATGCVAYWLLAGQPVFTADSPLGLMVRHAQEPPPPPSTRGELPIPPALEAVIMRCLAKDPARRPQTARELGQELAALDASAWTEDRARAWWESHQPAVA
jgi:hypothetical protein